jgi:hypothetical protein
MTELSPGTPAPSKFVHRPGDGWEAEAELAVSSVLVVELHPAGGYRWSPIVSSDNAIASVSGEVDESGVARYVVVGKASGVAVLSATTEHIGDRFGPQAKRWTLRAHVLGQSRVGY